MHAVFAENNLDLHQRFGWVYKALVIDSSIDTGHLPRFNIYILSDVQGTEEAEKQIISKLGGAVFPTNAENLISLLCKYLILEHLIRQTPRATTAKALNQPVTEKAVTLSLKIALDVRLLWFRRWKYIAVCCLLGVTGVCVMNTRQVSQLEESLISLLEELRPGEFTRKELRDIKRLLTQYCVVCRSTFVNHDVENSLRKISSMSCSKCKKNLRDLRCQETPDRKLC